MDGQTPPCASSQHLSTLNTHQRSTPISPQHSALNTKHATTPPFFTWSTPPTAMAEPNPGAHPEDEDELLSSGDSDLDPTTEEGRRRMDRREAIHMRAVERQIQKRHAEARSKIPAVVFEIPESLYLKAATMHDKLTDAERALLRSRGDLVGRALADPDTLTEEEAYRAMLWPAPDVVCANIKRVTGGRVGSPAELFAEARAGRILTVNECGLALGNFCAGEQPDWMRRLDVSLPGLHYASMLVFERRFYPGGVDTLLAPVYGGQGSDGCDYGICAASGATD